MNLEQRDYLEYHRAKHREIPKKDVKIIQARRRQALAKREIEAGVEEDEC